MNNNEFYKIIGNWISFLRKQKGLSLEALAYQSGISKGGLSEIERGMKEPRASTIFLICNTLFISLKDFLILMKLKNFQSMNKKMEPFGLHFY